MGSEEGSTSMSDLLMEIVRVRRGRAFRYARALIVGFLFTHIESEFDEADRYIIQVLEGPRLLDSIDAGTYETAVRLRISLQESLAKLGREGFLSHYRITSSKE